MKFLLLVFALFASARHLTFGDAAGGCAPIIVDENAFLNVNSDHYGLQNNHPIAMEGNCVSIPIVYGGGCGEVYFDLITDGILKTDAGNQKYYALKAGFVDNDSCEAIMRRVFKVDLSTLDLPENGIDYITIDTVHVAL